jgi:hypothetical protein
MLLNFPKGFSGRLILQNGNAVVPDVHGQLDIGLNVSPEPYLAQGFTMVQGTGTTAARPSVASAGTMFFDSTLGIPIWRNAGETLWVNSAGATV